MTLSLWRYSHFVLALLTAVFVFIAAVTGIILAFEPISNQLRPNATDDFKTMSIAEAIGPLTSNYEEIYSLEVDENGFLQASLSDKSGNSGNFYINPETGLKMGKIIKKQPVFEFATNLHRSLFLKSTGRFIIGLVSLLLAIIAVTGVILIAKRQGGFKRWFSKLVKEDFNQYAHVVLGRYTLIPILIITLTGVYLSLERFSVLPKSKIEHVALSPESNQDIYNPENFDIFKTAVLGDLVSLEFPFSPDKEDYYILKLKDREVFVHQYNGNVLSSAQVPLSQQILNWSIILHTGKGAMIWSAVLGLSCISILFFMYSGFSMSFKRIRQQSKFENTFQKENAEYILLTGSETGTTEKLAHKFAKALIAESKSVFVDSLNSYTVYTKAKQLLIFTSTYGEGDAPVSANNFLNKLNNIEQPNALEYAVVGFGSLLYPDYCKYAIEVDKALQKHKSFRQQLPLFKINNQSNEAFSVWIAEWKNANNVKLHLDLHKSAVKPKRLKSFKVIDSTTLNVDNTFILQLKPEQKIKYNSGDLLAVYPKVGEAERLYSIGKVDNLLTLSIKRHDNGLASNLLFNLEKGNKLKAIVRCNPDFHFPDKAKEVILISNGTGIAPFLGMINQKSGKVKTHLFWGGRNRESLSLYSDYIDKALSSGRIESCYFAFSQSGKRQYVQDLIDEQSDLFCNVLSNTGRIMICGSIAMQNDVLDKLSLLTMSRLKKPLSDFEENNQLLMDCY